jgi:predicted transcriptional regulator
MTAAEIATALGISERTARRHLAATAKGEAKP